MDSFFGIGLPELVLILVIAGVVMGPERIAHIARWLGKTTAQLQTISRAFVQQLHNEIDGIDDGEALKSAMSEMKSLRQELESLKSDFITSTTVNLSTDQTQTEEVPNSILPPQKAGSTAVSAANTNGNGKNTAVTAKPDPFSPADLPTPLEIEDDPES